MQQPAGVAAARTEAHRGDRVNRGYVLAPLLYGRRVPAARGAREYHYCLIVGVNTAVKTINADSIAHVENSFIWLREKCFDGRIDRKQIALVN